MKLPRFKCNWCGREYNDGDCFHNPFNITHKFGYESSYDGDILEVDLCPGCADSLANYIIENSTIDCCENGNDWSE